VRATGATVQHRSHEGCCEVAGHSVVDESDVEVICDQLAQHGGSRPWRANDEYDWNIGARVPAPKQHIEGLESTVLQVEPEVSAKVSADVAMP
jgi:hypothetical protein